MPDSSITASNFSTLTPDAVLNALESLGLQCDGRMLALNSYENRVYQIGIEDGPPLVAKFYRPGRWTDAAILEEHAFVEELVEREIPVVTAIKFNINNMLQYFDGFPAQVRGRRVWQRRQSENHRGSCYTSFPKMKVEERTFQHVQQK